MGGVIPAPAPSGPRSGSLPGPYSSIPGTQSYNSQADNTGRQRVLELQSSRHDLAALVGPDVQQPKKPSTTRLVLSGVMLVGALSLAGFVYVRFLGPQVSVPVVVSSASAPGSMDTPPTEAPVFEEEPKFFSSIVEGQKAFSAGDVSLAKKKFEEAAAIPGGATIAKVYIEQTTLTPQGACKTISFSHPRYTITAPAGRPTVTPNVTGAVVAWTDHHDNREREHVYSLDIDGIGKPISAVRDLTPEGIDANRPSLVSSPDKLALVYWEAKGREAGVRVRPLDQNGSIAKESILVGGAHEGQFWPSIEKALDGYWVVWQDSRDKRDKESDDVFIRKLDQNMATVGQETRLTDYVAPKKGAKAPNARVPSVAVAANQLFIAYKLERDNVKQIVRMRVPVNAQGLVTGLDEVKDAKKDREAGDTLVLSDEKDKQNVDNPAVACGRAGCFVAWHVDGGPAMAARIDPKDGKVVWKFPVAPKASRPALVTGAEGQVMVAFYEQGRVKMSTLLQDAPGPASTLARVAGDHPRPWVAPGTQKGEYWVAWEDFEAQKPEPYVARVMCK
jgi:serine/threonine-protein kinase